MLLQKTHTSKSLPQRFFVCIPCNTPIQVQLHKLQLQVLKPPPPISSLKFLVTYLGVEMGYYFLELHSSSKFWAKGMNPTFLANIFYFQVELHVHLDGAVRIQTIIDLAKYDNSWYSVKGISFKSSFINNSPALQSISNLMQPPIITLTQSHDKHCGLRDISISLQSWQNNTMDLIYFWRLRMP